MRLGGEIERNTMQIDGDNNKDSIRTESAQPSRASANGSGDLLQWRVCHPTETTTATQLVMQGEVCALYWHLSNGFQRTGGRKIYATEKEVQVAILNTAMQRTFMQLEILREELGRQNSAITNP